MFKFMKTSFIFTLLPLFFFGLVFNAYAAAITINDFKLAPSVVTNNTGSTQFFMTFRISLDVSQFNSACGSNTDIFSWYVYEGVSGVDLKRASGDASFSRTSTTLNLNVNQTITIDTTNPSFVNGGTAKYYGQINCPGVFSGQLARSAEVTITFGSVTNQTYACVANDNKYACSVLVNCSDQPACSGKPCIQIGSNLCGQTAGTGTPTPTPGGGGCGTTGQPACAPGTNQTYSFNIPNPLKGGVTDFSSLVKIIAQWIFNLAIPIAVAMIVYAGILFLTSAGDTSKVTKARQVLMYAVVGLAIILIGSGFITLIQSILELGGTTPAPIQTGGVTPTTTTTSGAVGNICSKNSNCSSGLRCKNTICQRQTGNLIGEACVSPTNCAVGLACDLTAQQEIDGQTLGTCI